MITKAIRQYLQADATLMDSVKNVFTFYNAVNMRRVNNALSKNTFPMITINELTKSLNTVHQVGNEHNFESQIEIQLDTIIEPDACNDKQIQNLNNLLDAHEDSAERIFTILHGFSGDMNGVSVGNLLFEESGDSQLVYNLYNNDKDQTVRRKTLNFNVNYKIGV